MKKYILGAAFFLALLASPALTHASGLTSSQIQAILSILQAFGADQSAINNVSTALNGSTQQQSSTQSSQVQQQSATTQTTSQFYGTTATFEGQACTFGTMYSSQYSDSGSTIERTQDGGYILGGSTNLRDRRASYHDLLVQKLDATGKIAWQKIIERGYTDFGDMDERGKQNSLFSVVPSPDGGYLAATNINNTTFGNNSDLLLIQTNASGTVQWQKSYGRREYFNHQYPLALRKVSGGYIIAGQTQKDNPFNAVDTFWSAFVMKVDDQGNVVWQKRLGTQEGATFASIVQASDGGYFVALTSSAVVSDQEWPGSAIVLFKLDAAGNTQWTKTYAAKFIAEDPVLAPAADGGFVAAFGAYDYSPMSQGRPQDIAVFKFGASGSVQWSRQYGTATGSENATAIQQTADGGYVVLGDDRDDALLFALDASGNIKWQKEYSTGQVWSGIGMDLPAGFTVTPDGGYTIVGKTNRFAPFAPTDEDGGQNRQSYDIFAFKTDASGNIAFLSEGGWSARDTNFETLASIISLVSPLRGGVGVADSFDLSASSISANVQSVNLSERDIAEQRCEPLISDNKPDLVISVPPSLNSGYLTAGSMLTFRATVKNQGGTGAIGTFNNRFRIDINHDGSIDSADPDIPVYNSISNLGAGSSQLVISPNWTAVAGTFQLYACADRPTSPGVIVEANEENNCAWGDTFTIVSADAPSITVFSPNGGEHFAIGSTQYLTWNTQNFGTSAIRINLQKNDTYLRNLFDSTVNDGIETWTVPSDLEPASDYKIIIRKYDDLNSAYDKSDAPFSIVASLSSNTYPNRNPGLASALGAFGGAENPVPQSTNNFSYVWNRDLQIGSPYPDDIVALQQALALEGVYAGEMTGGFYSQTYAAVKAFQQKHGIDATGYVGLITRSKLNALYSK